MEFKNKFLPTYYSSHSVMTLPWCIIVDHVLIFYIAIKLFVTLIPAMEIKVCQQNEERACTCVLSPVWCFAGPWIIAHQALLSIEFSRQEYCSGLPFPNSRGTSPPRDWTCISCIGKWILYCCAKSKPISPVLAITRSQLPSLDLAKIKGRQEVRKLYSEKKEKASQRLEVAGIMENATFPPPPSSKQGEKHKIWQLLTKSWMFWARCCRSCDLASWVPRWAFYSHRPSRLGLLVYSFSHCCNKHALRAGCFLFFFFSYFPLSTFISFLQSTNIYGAPSIWMTLCQAMST